MRGERRYDLVVLGAGAAGLSASITAAELGARVALVDPEPPGGDCLWTGCVPSKSLLAAAGLAQAMREAASVGLEPAEPRVDLGRVMARVREAIAAAGRPDTPEALAARGIEVVAERARFERPGLIVAGARRLPFRAAVIATGSRPEVPELSGLEQSGFLTNETIFDLEELPRRLCVLGGGPIGVELAQALARLGSEVDLIEPAARLLPREEPEASELLVARLRAEGVTLHLGARPSRVAPGGGGSGTLVAGRADGGGTAIAYDRMLVAIGRRPPEWELRLERVGVETEPPGWIVVDDRLRTGGDRIWAAGDCTGAPFYTHTAGRDGVAAALNALLRTRRPAPRVGAPAVAFTEPEVARAGATEAQARERLRGEPTVICRGHSELDRAITAGATAGFTKLVADRRGRLLGVTITGAGAAESIAGPSRIVAAGGKLSDLLETVHPYPTFGEAPALAAADWYVERARRARRFTRPLLAALRVVDRPRG